MPVQCRYLVGLIVTTMTLAAGNADAIDAAAIQPPHGAKLIGEAASDEAGRAIEIVGDINHDGYDDIAITAVGAARGANAVAGKVYVVFGSPQPFSSRDFDLASLNGANGFVIQGRSADRLLGWSVSTAGDFNGDGIDDMVIGGSSNTVNATPAPTTLIYGRNGAFPALLDLNSPPPNTSFALSTPPGNSEFGWSVSHADMNGDGFDDLLIGEWQSAAQSTGRVCIVFGQAGFLSGTLPIAGLNETSAPRMVSLTGTTGGARLGWSVTGMSDFNGDGLDDMAIGEPFDSGQRGSMYVVYGRSNQAGGALSFSASQSLGTLTTAQGFRWLPGNSAFNNARLGTSLASGDFDGDGKADIAVGAQTATVGGRAQAGAVFVIFSDGGNADAVTLSAADLGALNRLGEIRGARAGDTSGTALGSLGDFDNDGVDDLLISAHTADTPNGADSGRLWIVTGTTRAQLLGTLDLLTAPERLVWSLDGEAISDVLGFGLQHSSGDINGDGRPDIVTGALGAEKAGQPNNAGAGYVLLDGRIRVFRGGFEAPAASR